MISLCKYCKQFLKKDLQVYFMIVVRFSLEGSEWGSYSHFAPQTLIESQCPRAQMGEIPPLLKTKWK